MQIKKAERRKIKLKMAIEGPSGSGKTYSSLLIARGLAPGGRVLVIDSENGSASLYSHMYEYYTIDIDPPFTPEKYIQAIGLATRENFDVLIIDSASHEWNGKGGVLDIHAAIPGNSYVAWNKVTPRHQAFIDAILQTPIHVIACLRSKEKYALEENDKGKMEPRKLGAEAIQRDGLNYEFSTVLTMDISHQAMSTKDRTGLFNEQWFRPSEETGKRIAEYLNGGADMPVLKSPAKARPEDLNEIYRAYVEICGERNHALNAIAMLTQGRARSELTEDDVITLLEDIERRKKESA